MRFEDFVLQLDASSRGGFRARVVKSPFGEASAAFSLPSVAGSEMASADVTGASRDLGGHQGAHSAANTRPPGEMGTELFQSVFQGQVRTLLDKSRGRLEMSPDLGLRLKIKIDPGDEDTGALADLPWELLCDGDMEDFFALSRQTSLVRYLDVPRSSQPIPFTPPLRILAVSASPRGMQPLDIEEEKRRLEDLNQSSSGIEVRFVDHASAGAVREALSGDTYHVLHFMGHGTFDRASGEGMLAFEGAGGVQDLVSGRTFATKLRDLRSLGVVVLNACDTAKAGHQAGASPFRGVATALVLGGIPAVVAMQRPISDRAALGFSAAFYRHLARGESIDEALTEGRQAIHSAKPDTFEWATPVLFLRMPDGHVFVARPAERKEEQEKAEPRAEVPIRMAPEPAPAPPRRGLAFKVAAGAAAAGLVLVVYQNLYLAGNPPILEPESTPQTSEALTSDIATVPGRDAERHESRRELPERRSQESQDRKKPAPVSNDVEERESSSPPPVEPAPAPVSSQPAGVTVPAPAAADLSKLLARVIQVERREEGGIRVKVSVTNNSDLPMSVILDQESSDLSEYPSGGRYYFLGTSRRLDLAAHATLEETLDFPTAKLGSKQFTLFLASDDGRGIKLQGSSIKLEGPP